MAPKKDERTEHPPRTSGDKRAAAPASASAPPPATTASGRLRPKGIIGDEDLVLFGEGAHGTLFERLGAHPRTVGGRPGVNFAVWAPNAARISVIGSWNGWTARKDPLVRWPGSDIFEGFVAGVKPGATYKLHIEPRQDGAPPLEKADPFAFASEPGPGTASEVWDEEYAWGDGAWMHDRAKRNAPSVAISIYEVHLGSWRRERGEPEGRSLGYREIAPALAEYARAMGFTHVELMPVMEHPYEGSWGYQTSGYFSPARRWGRPEDLMFLIDTLHQRGVGVILDWAPAHFAVDDHGLVRFDGTPLFEHADPARAYHPEWGSCVFDLGKPEVRSFLLSSARFWIERFHADGLRVDAVAAMIHVQRGTPPEGEGGGSAAIAVKPVDEGGLTFLRKLNDEVSRAHPDVLVIAEESGAFPGVTGPIERGGLGFDLKWDMGWSHDTLVYLHEDPLFRRYHHRKLTFRGLYQNDEAWVLPLSHDDVARARNRSSLLGVMPGDEWQKLANVRLLLGYQYALPGKKLLFMGEELAPPRAWSHDRGIDWSLLEEPAHAGVRRWVADLNLLLESERALHELDSEPDGFEWIDCSDEEQSVLVILRRGRSEDEQVLAVCNFTPVPRKNYRVGVPRAGQWREVLNGDAAIYGGSGQGNMGGVEADPVPYHGRPASINLTLPPLAAVFLAWEGPRA